MENDVSQKLANAIASQQLQNAGIAPHQLATGIISSGSAPFPSSWANAKVLGIDTNAAMMDAQRAIGSREISIGIREVENGRLVHMGGKCYIVPQGTPLLEVIGQALVEAQLEK